MPLVVCAESLYDGVSEAVISEELREPRLIDGVKIMATEAREITASDAKDAVAAAISDLVDIAAPKIIEAATPVIIYAYTPCILGKHMPGIEANSRAEMLTDALEDAFGPVPDEFRERIDKSDKEDIRRLMRRYRKADSLDQIFKDSDAD